MPSSTGLKSRLCVYALPLGQDAKSIEALADRPFADVTDQSNRLLYQASAHEFFSLFANATVIVNAHAEEFLADQALAFLSHHPATDLAIAGLFSRKKLRQIQLAAQKADIEAEIHAFPEPRLFKGEFLNGTLQAFSPEAGFADNQEALRSCLAPHMGIRGTQYWTELWKNEIAVPASLLGIRKKDAFYSVARHLGRTTAVAANWSELGRPAGIPGNTVLEWVSLLERLCVLEIAPAINMKPERRTQDRPKVYWRHPGLGLWLSGQMTACPESLQLAFFENALYLALSDLYPETRIMHFADTNHVRCPLVINEDGYYQSYYICQNELQREQALRHHKSLVKTSRFKPLAALVTYQGLTSRALITYEQVAPSTGRRSSING